MADINVERKGPSIWPWIIGLLVLALLIWAIAEMVDTDDVRDVAEVEEVQEPPAAVPAPTPTRPRAAVELEDLMPFGAEDYGQLVMVDGSVVGTPIADGVWILANDNQAVFVQTPVRTEAGQVLQGDDLTAGRRVADVVGVVREARPEQAEKWINQGKLRDVEGFDTWTVHENVVIAAAPQGTTPGAPGQPGAQPPGAQQPGAQQPGTQQPGAQQQDATGRDSAPGY